MTAFYVYSLKDPCATPPMPFYIGKGTGYRAWEHVIKEDSTTKGRRIKAIKDSGKDVIITVLVEDLTELQALKIEAELIAAFGTEATGGLLTNSVIPTGTTSRVRNSLNIPHGSKEKAQLGLTFLKESILELAQSNPDGLQNNDIVKAFALQSDYLGGSKDYLTWSILGLLMREGKMERVPNSRKHQYKPPMLNKSIEATD